MFSTALLGVVMAAFFDTLALTGIFTNGSAIFLAALAGLAMGSDPFVIAAYALIGVLVGEFLNFILFSTMPSFRRRIGKQIEDLQAADSDFLRLVARALHRSHDSPLETVAKMTAFRFLAIVRPFNLGMRMSVVKLRAFDWIALSVASILWVTFWTTLLYWAPQLFVNS